MSDLLNDITYLLTDALELGLIWSLLALGIFVSFKVLDYADMTCESSFALGGATCATMIINGFDPFVALICGSLASFLAGIVTGLLHVKLKIPALLSGIITMIGLYSINLRVMMNKANLSLINQDTIFSLINLNLSIPQYGRIIISLIIVLVIFFVMYYFFGTEIGMSLRATGMNMNMAKASGINTSVMIVLGLGISNGLIGLGGGLLTQSQGFADINMGKGVIIIGLAAIIVGEVIFGKRSFKNRLISTILGTFLYYILLGIAMRLGLDPNDLKLLSAILIIIILASPLLKKQLLSNKNRGAQHA